MEYPELKLELKGDKLYVVLDELPDQVGLLYVSEKQSFPSRIGTVKNIGPKVTQFAVGDRVLISSYTGVNLYLWHYGIKDERHRIMREDEILGTVIV